jgi:integrase
MMRNALLIQLLITLLWRQQNIRLCKFMPFSQGGNLYKEPIPPSSRMKRSPWAQEALRANPTERFWQFFFRAHETKTEYVARGPLPIQIVQPLEQYIARYRGVLLGNRPDPGTLFFNRKGRPYDRKALTRIIGDITMKYGKVRVNPHLFRDIWAVKWLEDHPEDYLTVMKTLWHRKIDTSLKYGAGFDESHAAVRIEEWHNKRRK